MPDALLGLAPSRIRFCALLFAISLLPLQSPGSDTALPQPVSLPPLESTAVVLTVSTDHGSKRYSLPQIEALGLYRVTTSTFWPEDNGTYEGVLLAALLADAGLADGPAVRIAALDDFSQIIPREDWQRWPLLLATRRDGQPMSIRNKGPLRLIYPRDADSRLSDPAYRLRWVWMVNAIEPVAP
ncbi:MAG TPA: molybdopterin-dependent oxidoreductase [Candidatus Competibacteraceae bacterium]|nr:molybdopterin-dependent oxidoreductase [Candidatus Competibacteraceae bacterium]